MSSRDASTRSAASGDRYRIRVLDRAFSLLAIVSEGVPRTLVELSAEAGLNTTTTFRLLASLQSHNYVSRNQQTGQYSLGLACLELAHAFLGTSVRVLALPHLLALREETRETVHLAVLDRMEVVYVDKLDALHAIGLMSSQVGGRKPAYCTGVGKALLAYADPTAVREYYAQHGLVSFTASTITTVEDLLHELDDVRSRGYAFDLGENEAEVRCVAVPIFDASGHTVAALSVSGPATRLDPIAENEEVVGRATAAASHISTALGHRPDPRLAQAGGQRRAVAAK
jgi:IclR family KDG regulon transcriptional repressor